MGGQKIYLYTTMLYHLDTKSADRLSTKPHDRDIRAGHDGGVPSGFLRPRSSGNIPVSKCTVYPSPQDFSHLYSEGKRDLK